MGVIADITQLLWLVYFLGYAIVMVPTFGIVGLVGLGLSRSFTLIRTGNCLGIVGGLLTFIPYPIGALFTVFGVFGVIFDPSAFSLGPSPSASAVTTTMGTAMLIGILCEVLGYNLQRPLERFTHTELPHWPGT